MLLAPLKVSGNQNREHRPQIKNAPFSSRKSEFFARDLRICFQIPVEMPERLLHQVTGGPFIGCGSGRNKKTLARKNSFSIPGTGIDYRIGGHRSSLLSPGRRGRISSAGSRNVLSTIPSRLFPTAAGSSRETFGSTVLPDTLTGTATRVPPRM